MFYVFILDKAERVSVTRSEMKRRHSMTFINDFMKYFRLYFINMTIILL